MVGTTGATLGIKTVIVPKGTTLLITRDYATVVASSGDNVRTYQLKNAYVLYMCTSDDDNDGNNNIL